MSALEWTRSGERRTWVAEAPGGETLTVSKSFGSPYWVPAVLDASGVTRWTGTPSKTRLSAQRTAEGQARPATCHDTGQGE